ncbi:MAG: zinc ribbon domain-containing protein [Metallosphaera sp.]
MEAGITLKCPKCGTSNSLTHKYCYSCGTKLNINTFCKKCNYPVHEDMLYCPNCGNALKEDYVYQMEKTKAELELNEKDISFEEFSISDVDVFVADLFLNFILEDRMEQPIVSIKRGEEMGTDDIDYLIEFNNMNYIIIIFNPEFTRRITNILKKFFKNNSKIVIIINSKNEKSRELLERAIKEKVRGISTELYENCIIYNYKGNVSSEIRESY